MTAIERAVEAVRQHVGDQPEADIHVARVVGMLYGYWSRWGSVPLVVEEVEQTFHLPIVNPATGKASPKWTQAGKRDGIVRLPTGQRLLFEHKTCDEEIADPNAPYWRRLSIDQQISMYSLACWQSGKRVDGTLYDVIRKPRIRPKTLTKAEVNAALASGMWHGFVVGTADLDRLRDGDSSESIAMFATRVTAECIDNADKYYQRRVITRLDSELLEWSEELWGHMQDINAARLANRHPKNDGACMNWGYPCPYLGVCSGHEQLDQNERFAQDTAVHGELDLAEQPHSNVLTNTRIRTFQTCRRKHYYRYELGYRRSEDSEALYVGSLLHLGLEVLFSLSQESSDDDSSRAANGVARQVAETLPG